jgi:hypothetical protein
MKQIEHVKIRLWNINWIDIIGVHIGTKTITTGKLMISSQATAMEFSQSADIREISC